MDWGSSEQGWFDVDREIAAEQNYTDVQRPPIEPWNDLQEDLQAEIDHHVNRVDIIVHDQETWQAMSNHMLCYHYGRERRNRHTVTFRLKQCKYNMCMLKIMDRFYLWQPQRKPLCSDRGVYTAPVLELRDHARPDPSTYWYENTPFKIGDYFVANGWIHTWGIRKTYIVMPDGLVHDINEFRRPCPFFTCGSEPDHDKYVIVLKQSKNN